jgi:hypothetical protein
MSTSDFVLIFTTPPVERRGRLLGPSRWAGFLEEGVDANARLRRGPARRGVGGTDVGSDIEVTELDEKLRYSFLLPKYTDRGSFDFFIFILKNFLREIGNASAWSGVKPDRKTWMSATLATWLGRSIRFFWVANSTTLFYGTFLRYTQLFWRSIFCESKTRITAVFRMLPALAPTSARSDSGYSEHPYRAEPPAGAPRMHLRFASTS